MKASILLLLRYFYLSHVDERSYTACHSHVSYKYPFSKIVAFTYKLNDQNNTRVDGSLLESLYVSHNKTFAVVNRKVSVSFLFNYLIHLLPFINGKEKFKLVYRRSITFWEKHFHEEMFILINCCFIYAITMLKYLQ